MDKTLEVAIDKMASSVICRIKSEVAKSMVELDERIKLIESWFTAHDKRKARVRELVDNSEVAAEKSTIEQEEVLAEVWPPVPILRCNKCRKILEPLPVGQEQCKSGYLCSKCFLPKSSTIEQELEAGLVEEHGRWFVNDPERFKYGICTRIYLPWDKFAAFIEEMEAECVAYQTFNKTNGVYKWDGISIYGVPGLDKIHFCTDSERA